MIPYGKHNIQRQDIDAVVDVLKNHFLTQGQHVPVFEKAICDYTSAKHCIAVNSGTSGLHVACMALGIKSGDVVWTSPNSFAASANCARYCQADVDFVDIDPVSRNMCPIVLEKKLFKAREAGRLPKAIVLVHFAGVSCDILSISKLCKPLNIAIIEDAAHALGATYEKMPVGACQYSDIAVLSFHPVKSITTAEGGAITTNCAKLAEKCKLYAKHGITREPNLMVDKARSDDDGQWYYQQLCLGYNYRLSDLQAALGLSQLKRLDDFIFARRQKVKRYLDALSALPISLPQSKALDHASWHLFMIELQKHKREEIYNRLHEKGIGVNVHYIPIHLHPYYRDLGFKLGQFPNAENFYKNALTLPLFVDLSDQEQQQVINTLVEVLGD